MANNYTGNMFNDRLNLVEDYLEINNAQPSYARDILVKQPFQGMIEFYIPILTATLVDKFGDPNITEENKVKYPAYNDPMELNGFKHGRFTVDLSAELAAIPRSQSNQALKRNQLKNTLPTITYLEK